MGASSSDEISSSVVRALIDTNVVLDLLLRREPWATQAQPLVGASAAGQVISFVPTSALTDVFHIGRRLVGIERAFDAIDRCLTDFQVLSGDRAIIEVARSLPGNDFEDIIQIACATAAGLDLIITRDMTGFTHSSIPAIAPAAITGHLRGS